MRRTISAEVNPQSSIQPFLLIGRTCRIVTALGVHDSQRTYWVYQSLHPKTSSAGFNRLFQHLAKFKDSADSLSHDVLNPARVPL